MSRKFVLGIFILLVGITGCTASGDGNGGSDIRDAVRSWFDAPQPRTVYAPPSPCQIVAHGAAPAGIAQFELIVNGQASSIPSQDTQSSLAILTRDCAVTEPGTYQLRLRAQDNSGAWSGYAETSLIIAGPAEAVLPTSAAGPTSSPTATSTPATACTNQAKFIADITIPDNTNLAPGAAFTKTWRLQNSGTCTWDENYKVVFVGGAPLSNPTPQSVPGIVAPGATVDISLNLAAPGSPGTYKSDYQLRSPENEHFGVGANGGVPFYIQIVVGATSVPPTSVPTSGPDTQAPSVSISHNPPGSAIPTGNNITFTANASDNVGVTGIDIWVTAPGQFPTLVKTCNNTNNCSFTGGPYNTAGNLSYFAIARDGAGNETNSGGHTINLYVEVR